MDRLKEVWFFDGQVRVDQPAQGYRAGTDALLLAMSVQARPNDKILDLGTGSAIVPCLLHHRFSHCQITGLERDVAMRSLARQNTKDIRTIEIVSGDVGDIPKSWHLQFDQVVSNPPFFDDAKSIRMSQDKAPSFVAGDTCLKDWIAAMLVTLKPRGLGTLIYRADGLEKILYALFGKAGRIRICPIHSYADEPAKRIIVQFRKGVNSKSAIKPALIMHERNTDSRYTEAAQAVLNGKTPLIMA